MDQARKELAPSIGECTRRHVVTGTLATSPRRRPRARLWRAFVTAVALASAAVTKVADAQSVRGEIVERGTGAPVAGALVTVLDDSRHELARRVADAIGGFAIPVPRSGSYVLLVRRIGSEPVRIAVDDLGATETRRVTVEMSAIETHAATVRVTAARTCGESPSEGLAAQLWTDARTALATADLTAQSGEIRVIISHDLRVLEPTTLRVVRSRQWADTARTVRPFASVPAAELAAAGYVIAQTGGKVVYRAPDATVLTSDSFVRQHCFSVVEPGEPEGAEFADVTRTDAGRTIGIAFTPSPERHLPDIRGVIWLDAGSRQLRHVRFNYTTLDSVEGHGALGGDVDFARLASGAWIVENWWLRLPELSATNVQRRLPEFGIPHPERRIQIDTIRESGAQVIVAEAQPFRIASTRFGALTGIVRDTGTGNPVPKAAIRLVGTGLRATSGSDGRFLVDSIPAGLYRVEVAVAPWDTVSVPLPTRDVRIDAGEAVGLDLWAPTLVRISRAICPSRVAGISGRDSAALGAGILRGTVRTEHGGGVPDALVAVGWSEYGRTPGGPGLAGVQVNATARTKADGSFLVCGIRVDHPLTLEISDPKDDRVVISRDTSRLPPLGVGLRHIVVRTLATLPAHATGAILGSILSSVGRQPIGDVEVIVQPGNLSVRSNDSGRFVVQPLAAGTYHLIVRKPGFDVASADATLVAGDSLTVDLTLDQLPVQLGAVRTNATGLPLSDFERRRKVGTGIFLTREMLEARGSFQLANLILATAPHIELVRHGPNHVAVASRVAPFAPCGTFGPCNHARGWPDKCYVQIIVDGAVKYTYDTGNSTEPFDINSLDPLSLDGVEIYVGAAETPTELNATGSACGTVVLWTRRDGKPNDE